MTPARPARAPQAGLPGESPGAPTSRPEAPQGRDVESIPVTRAAVVPTDDVLRSLVSDRRGLTEDEVLRRRAAMGPNAVRSHHARPWAVLGRQLASPLLMLLLVTALVSFVVGEQTDAVIIAVILAASVGLGFVNEYRAERTAEALHSAVHHLVVVTREGAPRQVDVTELVPGDVVRLTLGAVVPADLRLMSVTGLECNESVLTGESAATTKRVAPVAEGTVLAELDSCALMGTVVTAGSGTGVVVATGGQAEFGRIAVGLGHRQPETEFQIGLRRFSGLLLTIAFVLTSFILITNLVLARPLLDSILFSLAIAVGITPQLLPAVVSTSLATGSRRLARRKVLVKRLVCIEDLGDVDVLVTDKTGTLTEGSISLQAALDPDGAPSEEVLGLGLLANQSRRDQHQPARRGDHRGRNRPGRAPQGGGRSVRPRAADVLGARRAPRPFPQADRDRRPGIDLRQVRGDGDPPRAADAGRAVRRGRQGGRRRHPRAGGRRRDG